MLLYFRVVESAFERFEVYRVAPESDAKVLVGVATTPAGAQELIVEEAVRAKAGISTASRALVARTN